MASPAETASEAEGIGGVPNANSPVLLTHLLEMVARGLRSGRGLAEALGVDQRTVRYYVHAGAWLGFLEDGSEPLLTPDGLSFVYGGPHRHARYAAAVERQPFVAGLIKRLGRFPDDGALRLAIAAAEPGLSAATVERRASAVRGLVAPLLETNRPGRSAAADDRQLALPLAQAPALAPDPPLTRAAGRSFSPDIYAYLFATLLDHGELTLGHVRGLLDRAGADDVAIGPYVDLALERGDVERVEERLVITAGAAALRDVAANATAVVLTDPGWRAHVERWRSDPAAAARAPARYRLWDQRLFGRPLAADTVHADLGRALRDRNLSAWPIARPAPGRTGRGGDEPFLDLWEREGLIIALPPTLAHLWEGLGGVNRRLRSARHRTDAVGAPTIAYSPVVVHGGLLHPGEALPRAVPDARSLRQRTISRAPYAAMVVAMLLAHRAEPSAIELRLEHGAWWVRARRRRVGPLLEVCDAFAAKRGWVSARRGSDGLSAASLLSVAERLGVVALTPDRAVLDDTLFHQLRHDEEAVLAPSLDGLSRALRAHVDALVATDAAS
jgi:hypothetical protein